MSDVAISMFIALPLLAVGVALIKRGRWPARVGTTPHCRKCDYMLTGLEAERCPECGSFVARRGTLLGERHRRPRLTWIGAICAVLGVGFIGLLASGALSRVNWNQYKPLSWLLKQADSPRSLEAQTAIKEIDRRLAGGLLSDAQLNMLVERALQAQQSAGTTTGGYEQTLFRLLDQRIADHKLSDAQEQRFYDNALKVVVAVRPVVGALDRVPYSIYGQGRGPEGWCRRERCIEWQIDGGTIEKGSGSSSNWGGGFAGWGNLSSLPPQPIGKHHLHVRYELSASVKAPPSVSGPYDKVVVRELDADFVSVEGHTAITTVTAPPASTLQPLLNVRVSQSGSYLNLSVDAAPLPVDVAFECFVRAGGKEYSMSGVNFHKAIHSGYTTGTDTAPDPILAKVDVILRSSEEVARGTPFLTQIWKGEIEFRDVVVTGRRPATTPATTATTFGTGR